jgi:hypothetical protein
MSKFCIKKKMINNSKITIVLLTDGHSEILEYEQRVEAEKLVLVMNANSDSNWEYEVFPIGQ